MEHPVNPSRRTALTAAAWSVPVATVAAASPAFAVSPVTSTGLVTWGTGTSPIPGLHFEAPASGVHVPVTVGAIALTWDAGVAGNRYGPQHLDVVTVDASAGVDALTFDLRDPAPGRTMQVALSFSRAVSNVRIPITGLAVAFGRRDAVTIDAAAGALSVASEAEPWLSVVTADGRSRVEVIQAGGRDGTPLAPETTAMLQVAGPVTAVDFVFFAESTSLSTSYTPLPQYPLPYISILPSQDPGASSIYLGNVAFDVTA